MASKALNVRSFRDPSGFVLIADGRVFRTIEKSALADFQIVQRSGILQKLALKGLVIASREVTLADIPASIIELLPPGERHFVEHDRIPFISYPYEWHFTLLKRAALHYLDLHLELIQSNFTLVDSSAYNVQFVGTRPIFIDILSIRPYIDGAYWAGYRQFCEQFLSPLLLTAIHGISHQSWFRGHTEGIPLADMVNILSIRSMFHWKVILHIYLHAQLEAKGIDALSDVKGVPRRPMSKAVLTWLLRSMRNWIVDLRPRRLKHTLWQSYDRNTSYSEEETTAKRAFIIRYVERAKPSGLLDLGCNTGVYSQIAISAGTKHVVGIDYDLGAIAGAIGRSDDQTLNLLPLVIDVMNPSPNQGWAQREWLGFKERFNADGVLALAFLHHIIIGRNVSIAHAVEWLIALAPSGVIEFIPKSDPMVRQMLVNRDDIFPTYDLETFRTELARHASIVNESIVSNTGRTMFEYQR